MNILDRFIKRDPRPSAILVAFVFLASTLQIINNNPINAETGKGADVFKVILTVFGVENTKGDIVAIATVNNGEASKVKFLETEGFRPVLISLL